MSVREEIERRIAFSFDMADTPRNEFILRAMAQALRYTEAVMDIPWNKSPAAALVCRDALVNASDLVVRSYAYDLHPSDISDVSSDETGEQAFEKRKAKIAEGVGLAGESIGLQVVQAFLGKPIDEIRTIGADHILAAKAFAEQWKRETFGWAGNSLGDLPRPPASPDEEEDAAEASEPQAAPAPRKGPRAKAGT